MRSYVGLSPLIHTTTLIVYALGECDCEVQSLDEGRVSDWRLIQSGKMNLFKLAVLISTPQILVFNPFKKWLPSAFGKIVVIIMDFCNSERKEEQKQRATKI